MLCVQPDGVNVYPNVPRDYTGEVAHVLPQYNFYDFLVLQNVTVANFINILRGDKEAMRGIGSGKVIER